MRNRFQIQTLNKAGTWEQGVVVDDLHLAISMVDKLAGWLRRDTARVWHTEYSMVVYKA